MNEFVRQAIIVVLCAPIAYLILRLIFKKSIMFTFSFYVILYVLYITYMSVLIGKIGGYTMYWVTPLNFAVGALVFAYINKILRKPLEESILKVNELSKDWGTDLYDKISDGFEATRETNEDMRKQADYQIERLESEIDDLKSEIKELESQLDAVS